MLLSTLEQELNLKAGAILKIFEQRYILSDRKELKGRPHRCLVVGDDTTAINLGWFVEIVDDHYQLVDLELTPQGYESVIKLLKNNQIIP